MTILEEINLSKKREVERAKKKVSVEELCQSEGYNRTINSLVKRIQSLHTSVIAEFKTKSPSKGLIHPKAQVEIVTRAYSEAGCAGLSVLTDSDYFGGSPEHVKLARKHNPHIPILRKDFMIDPYQIYEAKSWGADVVLLIAASLSPEQISNFSALAHNIGLEVLLEVHNTEEVKKSPMEHIDLIGVNNRNLKNFSESNVNASLELFDLLPEDKVKISESCLSQPKIVKKLKQVGYQGFLIGEAFMKTEKPGETLRAFINSVENG